jgi:hypothetical protein
MSTTITPSTQGGCGCGCRPGQDVCDDPAGLERTRFFPRQLVGPEDFTQDQRYFREKHRRHNRMLHGWGIVCGVGVTAAADAQRNPIPFTVCVAPGYVLGPYGDEILVDRPVAFDVRRAADDTHGGCPPPVDPWCAPVRVDRDPDRTLYLAIRYDECDTRPVQTDSGCGCGSECEYSRIVDGFTLGILDTLPDAYAAEDGELGGRVSGNEFLAGLRCTPALHETGRPCPPCPNSPWVILADLRVPSDGGVEVDQWQHRRFVVAFGPYGFYCPATAVDVSADVIRVDTPVAADSPKAT